MWGRGHWEAPAQPGASWQPGNWEHHGNGWSFQQGHWGGHGGAVVNDGSDVTMQQFSSIHHNTARFNGGASPNAARQKLVM